MKIQIRLFLPLIISVSVIFGFSSGRPGNTRTGRPEATRFRAVQFPLAEVRLLDGPFLHATQLDMKTLLIYEPDRLLSRFYSEAGLPPKADHYMGWENETLAGHTLGHYLSACSMMYQTTGDERFLDRVNYIADELKKVQDAGGSGYIGAFPEGRKIFEQQVAKGDIRAKAFDLNGIWSPFYTMHKILAGLRDAYELCGSKTALEVERRFADWINDIVAQLSNDQVQKMLICEYGGMSEVLADLFANTGNQKYLKLAGIFYDKAVLDPLKENIDILPGRHCNTNIPKLIGLSRLFELTGDASDRNAAEFFWNTVVKHHSYVTGGNGNNEYFGQPDKLRDQLGANTTETCNVYNMLKLTEHIFEWNVQADAADFYERALLNHILSSQNPIDGHVTYNLSLKTGGFKDFQDPFDFTCCIGTGMENHSKYGRNIFYHTDKELFLFQYIACRLDWKEKGLLLTQKTNFPDEQGTTLEFKCEKPVRLTLRVRYPSWAESGISIAVNGEKLKIKAIPGSFIPVKRIWKSGDRVEVKIPFSLRLETMPDDTNRVAVMYGPLVMAGNLGLIKDSAAMDLVNKPLPISGSRNPAEWMKPAEGRINTFIMINPGLPEEIEVRPFYSFYDRRYSVYWDFTPGGIKRKDSVQTGPR
ncbi:MAG: beta-L-arabinofuranosidase domain-containing protein [Bacteroidales bacterium]|jgi:hypothetical protein